MNRVQIASVLGLCACAAGFGLLWSRAALPVSETEVIEAMAARYVAETGGALTDCFGRVSAEDWAWIIVECEGTAGRFLYPVDRSGRLVAASGAGT